MSGKAVDNDQKRRIDQVVNYISEHLDDQVSLETLAGVAHYSPFHLQKVFKQIVGDSPKQYMIKLRLETAFHLLVIHPQKSVQEISAESGFSSPAVFSRAIRGYFGHSPEQIRQLSHRAKMKLLHSFTPKSFPKQSPIPGGAGGDRQEGKPTIRVIKRGSVKGIYFLAPFDKPEEIQLAFKQLAKIAGVHEWPGSGMYGLLGPHQRNSYKAFLPVDQEAEGTDKFTFTEIKGGTFATFKVRGDLKQVNKAAHYFYREWLPDSGYKIAGTTGFETFAENPAFTPYHQLEREIHIPIGPAN
jgi:AraC family transcriptional regulator